MPTSDVGARPPSSPPSSSPSSPRGWPSAAAGVQGGPDLLMTEAPLLQEAGLSGPLGGGLGPVGAPEGVEDVRAVPLTLGQSRLGEDPEMVGDAGLAQPEIPFACTVRMAISSACAFTLSVI